MSDREPSLVPPAGLGFVPPPNRQHQRDDRRRVFIGDFEGGEAGRVARAYRPKPKPPMLVFPSHL